MICQILLICIFWAFIYVLIGCLVNAFIIVLEAREKGEFLSKEDLIKRTQLSNTLVRKLEILGCLNGMQEENQMSLF